ncbi:hypothetical protein SLEP1_g3470 [Rubroshorea leprosula]|uniref:Integrase catalytic domain-containing protein n=1 Tax=Rubroshorea leprosula TaxID=152421 RepID=A0AAV5HKH9_9ROSI|nr:hypothetical protein SLEP1_g3470 [Rubroshorea leprosula]
MAFENYVQPSIPRFDGHHYDHWSMLMENFFQSKKYWTIVEAKVPKPEIGANDAQRAEIEKEKFKDLKAKNYLFQAIDWAILETILNKSNSKNIWDSMKKKYQGNERAKRQQHQALRADFKTTVNSRAVGRGKENWKGKPRSGKPRSDRLEESSSIGIQKRWQNRNYQATDNRSKSAGKANIECFRCHKYDHYRSECSVNLNRGESFNFVEHNEKNDDSSLFMVCHPKEVNKKNVWYLDISCSNHMCRDKSTFSDLDESCQDKVKFGNNSTIAVKGRGKTKLEALAAFKNFKALVENEVGKSVKVLRTNHGGEFNSKEFADFCESNSIKRQLTAAYTPQHNGVCERRNCTIMNMVRSLMSKSGLPKEFWLEVINWSVHILNRSPTSPLPDLTLEEAWSGRRPAVDYFRIFGCIAYAHVPDQKRNCDPLTYKEAVKEEKWQKAMAKEIGSIERNQTWELIDLLEGHKIIGVKWIYKTKLKENGMIDKFKARLVARGYKQEFGIDYQEVFAPVARMDTIRLVIALAAQNSWPIYQLDVTSAFVHGNLQEQEVLDRFQMKNYNYVTTLVDKGVKLVKDPGGRSVDSKLYKQTVGSLMYLTATRPDIMHGVSLISRYMEHLKELHLQTAKRILKYLCETVDFGLFYKKGDQTNLAGFTDSDYAGDLDDRKSTSRFVFMLGSGAISWSLKKQPIVTLSTTEAEYVAATSCACQAIWLS